jgi:hypothetical protein
LNYYFYLHNSFITEAYWGYKFDSTLSSASSKSAKSNPGATVHPTKQKLLPAAGLLANQQLAGTTY